MLVSVGRAPNGKGIGLENTKAVVTERGYVQVDRNMRTADPKIMAIGDVAGEPMLAHKATREAKVAVETLLANRPSSTTSRSPLWSSPTRTGLVRNHRS